MSAAPFDAVDLLTKAVQDVADDLPDLIAASTAPDLADLAAPYAALSEAAGRLRSLLDDLGDAIAREMTGDLIVGKRFRLERHRTTDRKKWDHESVRRRSQRAILRRNGALAAVLVDRETGAQLEVTPQALVAEGQEVYGSKEPLVGQMTRLGLDTREFCETSRGRIKVDVIPLADENTPESGDAA